MKGMWEKERGEVIGRSNKMRIRKSGIWKEEHKEDEYRRSNRR